MLKILKGKWSRKEDEILIEMVNKHGPNKWADIARAIPGRNNVQCRDRWKYYLDPAVNKEAWSEQEEITLIRAHKIYGNKWSEMTKLLPRRTHKAIKNYWNGRIKKKLEAYLSSGLLEQFPGLPENPTVQQSSDSCTLKDSQGEDSSERNRLSSASVTSSESKRGLDNVGAACDDLGLGEDADGEYSDFICPKRYDTDVVEVSQMVDVQMDSQKLPGNAERRSTFLSGSFELEMPITEAICPSGSLEKEKPMISVADCRIGKSSQSDLCQDVLPEGRIVAPDDTDTVFFSTLNRQPDNAHCLETHSSFDSCSFPLHLATVSDLIDMPYCQTLMIIPPDSPCDGNSMYEGDTVETDIPVVAGLPSVLAEMKCSSTEPKIFAPSSTV